MLNPARPLFREARYPLAEDSSLREPALYHSILTAVAEGNRTRGGMASCIGRKATDLQHPLTVLEDAGLLVRQPDLLRSGYRITEPLVNFHHAVVRPAWTLLEQRQGPRVAAFPAAFHQRCTRSAFRGTGAPMGGPLRLIHHCGR